MSDARQLAFDWPQGVALEAEDFFVSSANAQAFAMVSAPDSWPDGKLVIAGPAASGKSHLARIFAAQSGATLVSAADLATGDLPEGRAVVVEDMEQLPPEAEEAMFHLHNRLRNAGGRLLMTAREAPSRWDLALRDLASRMQAATVVEIDDPDDALLQAVIMKLFMDRQLLPAPTLAQYLAPRIERSFAAAADIVARLDAQALSEARPITRALAARLLDSDAGAEDTPPTP